MDPTPRPHWPAGVAREVTISAFLTAFLTLGYTVCADESIEPGFEKLAIFADSAGIPTHAARQLSTGRWTSKLGQVEDMEHDLRALEGHLYGAVAVLLKQGRVT